VSTTPGANTDSERKIRLVIDALHKLSAAKQRKSAWGEVSIQLFWENGLVKTVEITDTTTIRQLPSEDW